MFIHEKYFSYMRNIKKKTNKVVTHLTKFAIFLIEINSQNIVTIKFELNLKSIKYKNAILQ